MFLWLVSKEIIFLFDFWSEWLRQFDNIACCGHVSPFWRMAFSTAKIFSLVFSAFSIDQTNVNKKKMIAFNQFFLWHFYFSKVPSRQYTNNVLTKRARIRYAVFPQKPHFSICALNNLTATVNKTFDTWHHVRRCGIGIRYWLASKCQIHS